MQIQSDLAKLFLWYTYAPHAPEGV